MDWVQTQSGMVINLGLVTHINFTKASGGLITARLYFVGHPIDKSASLMLVDDDAQRLADWFK